MFRPNPVDSLWVRICLYPITAFDRFMLYIYIEPLLQLDKLNTVTISGLFTLYERGSIQSYWEKVEI